MINYVPRRKGEEDIREEFGDFEVPQAPPGAAGRPSGKGGDAVPAPSLLIRHNRAAEQAHPRRRRRAPPRERAQLRHQHASPSAVRSAEERTLPMSSTSPLHWKVVQDGKRAVRLEAHQLAEVGGE